MSVVDARMWQIAEDAARSVTDELTGRFESKDLRDEIYRRLSDGSIEQHVYVVMMDRMAKTLSTSFVRARSPRLREGFGLYFPGAVLPMGDGKRVWMEFATDSDLLEWDRQSVRNLARVASASVARSDYVSKRIQAFRDHPDWLLGRIEQDVFGYVAAEDPWTDGMDVPQ